MTNALCPVARKRGKPVPLVTLRSLLLPEHAAVIEGRAWFFCSRPDCEVVYFTPRRADAQEERLESPGGTQRERGSSAGLLLLRSYRGKHPAGDREDGPEH